MSVANNEFVARGQRSGGLWPPNTDTDVYVSFRCEHWSLCCIQRSYAAFRCMGACCSWGVEVSQQYISGRYKRGTGRTLTTREIQSTGISGRSLPMTHISEAKAILTQAPISTQPQVNLPFPFPFAPTLIFPLGKKTLALFSSTPRCKHVPCRWASTFAVSFSLTTTAFGEAHATRSPSTLPQCSLFVIHLGDS